MSEVVFTVSTQTYNRIDSLPRVYESLKAQTFRGFEWLIVDDGSTDGTEELVKAWQSSADFPIRYFYQPNLGKHGPSTSKSLATSSPTSWNTLRATDFEYFV